MTHFIEIAVRGSTKAGAPLRNPGFWGPTIRGAIGFALKELLCQVRHRNCPACDFRAKCTYPRLFDGDWPAEPGSRRTFTSLPLWLPVVEGPVASQRSGRELQFALRLFGPSVRYWPYMVEAVRQAFERGIGQDSCQLQLQDISDGVGGPSLLDGCAVVSVPPSPRECCQATTIPEGQTLLRWQFSTPVQLKKDNQQISLFDPLDLILAGRRRWNSIRQLAGDLAPDQREDRIEPGEFRIVDQDLRTWGFSRFSGRQKKSMNLFGVFGSFSVIGPWHRAGQWLGAVRQIHLGGKTAFGFGRVAWELN